MAGYIRQDVSNNISNGNLIDAALFDAEYNAIEAAFHASTGHVHDGSAANGAPITVIGPAQDFIADADSFTPKTNATYDLGNTSLRFRDGWFTRDVHISDDLTVLDDLTIGGDSTFAGTVSITGALTASGGVTGALTGNASTATTLATGRTIAISTGVTGTATSFNGSANITIPVTAIDANYITSGTLAVERLPTSGTSGATDWFRELSASILATNVPGTYGFLRNDSDSTLFPGSLVDGADLVWSNTANTTGGGVPAGTWICMGRAPVGVATLFARVE